MQNKQKVISKAPSGCKSAISLSTIVSQTGSSILPCCNLPAFFFPISCVGSLILRSKKVIWCKQPSISFLISPIDITFAMSYNVLQLRRRHLLQTSMMVASEVDQEVATMVVAVAVGEAVVEEVSCSGVC